MEENEFLSRIHSLLQQYKLPVFVGLAGLLFSGYGLSSMLLPQPIEEPITFTAGTENAQEVKAAEDSNKEIFIDIEGAVTEPGVYTLPADSRIKDVVERAGGLSDTADTTRIAQTINLAAKATDGMKLYIPSVGETVVIPASNSEGGTSEQININSASSSELESLPGIGEVTAGKIIDNRPYGAIEELLEKKVVGNSVFEKIKSDIVAY